MLNNQVISSTFFMGLNFFPQHYLHRMKEIFESGREELRPSSTTPSQPQQHRTESQHNQPINLHHHRTPPVSGASVGRGNSGFDNGALDRSSCNAVSSAANNVHAADHACTTVINDPADVIENPESEPRGVASAGASEPMVADAVITSPKNNNVGAYENVKIVEIKRI